MTCPFCDNPNQPSWTTCPCPGADNARLYGVKDAWQHHQTRSPQDSARNPPLAPPDNPDTDGSDTAHPAWWRGLNTGLTQAAQIIDNASLGNDDPTTVLPDNHPLDLTRKRVLTLAQRPETQPAGYTPGSLPNPSRENLEDACALCGWRREAGGEQHHDDYCPTKTRVIEHHPGAPPSGDSRPSEEARRDQADLIAALSTPKGPPHLPECDLSTRDIGDSGPEASASSMDLDDRREAILLFAAGIAAANPDLATWINRAATAVLSGEAIPTRRPAKVRGKGRRRGG